MLLNENFFRNGKFLGLTTFELFYTTNEITKKKTLLFIRADEKELIEIAWVGDQ